LSGLIKDWASGRQTIIHILQNLVHGLLHEHGKARQGRLAFGQSLGFSGGDFLVLVCLLFRETSAFDCLVQLVFEEVTALLCDG